MLDDVRRILSVGVYSYFWGVVSGFWGSIEGNAVFAARHGFGISGDYVILIFNFSCIFVVWYSLLLFKRRFNLEPSDELIVIPSFFLFILLLAAIYQAIKIYPILLFVIVIAIMSLIAYNHWKRWRLFYRNGFTVHAEGAHIIRYDELYGEEIRSLRLPWDTGHEITIHIPSDAEWDEKMPDWAKGRKEEIASRIISLFRGKISRLDE